MRLTGKNLGEKSTLSFSVSGGSLKNGEIERQVEIGGEAEIEMKVGVQVDRCIMRKG